MAQRQRQDGRDSFTIMHHFWQADADFERQSRCPTGAGVGQQVEYLLHTCICSKYDQTVARSMEENRPPQTVRFLYEDSPDQRQNKAIARNRIICGA